MRNAVISSTLTEEIVGFIVEFHIKCFSTLWCFIVILTKVFRYCELPVECRGCGLTLVSAPHLARSYHHLFPLLIFKVKDLVSLKKKIFIPIFHVNDIVKEVEPRNVPADRSWCNGCGQLFKPDKDKAVYQCPQCDQVERKCIYSNQCLGST